VCLGDKSVEGIEKVFGYDNHDKCVSTSEKKMTGKEQMPSESVNKMLIKYYNTHSV